MGGTADHVWPRGVWQTIVLHGDAVIGCAELAQNQRIVTELFEVKRRMFQCYLAVFDFAHLEDVVNQREQVIGGNTSLGAAFAGDLDIAFLQFLDIDKAQDAVERRTDVVAHAREECRLSGVGGVGFFALGSSAHERPDEQDDADRQHTDEGGGNGGAVAIKELKRVGFLGRVRRRGVIACGERFSGIDDALVDDSQQLGLSARNPARELAGVRELDRLAVLEIITIAEGFYA